KISGFPGSSVVLPTKSMETLDWTAPCGHDWKVMVFARKFMKAFYWDGYTDLMNPDAVAKFIEYTHEEYAKHMGEYFADSIDGFFTDEPAMYYEDIVDGDKRSIAWTPSLPTEFSLRYGYDFISVLPALFTDAGELTEKIRCDFYETCTYLYQQAFFKQIYDFCDKYKIKSVGHVMQEGEMKCHPKRQGDFFMGVEYMHYSGADFICDLTWPSKVDSLNNLLGLKFASSAGHLLEKPRNFCESFGLAGQWGVNLRMLKNLSDWAVGLGMNVLSPILRYTIVGFHKYVCPPSHFYHSSLWTHYDLLTKYITRLCSIFSEGSHTADAAVLYPIRSFWGSMAPDPSPVTEKLLSGFEYLTFGIIRSGFDFDIVSEEMVSRSELSSGSIDFFGPGGKKVEDFKVLILPPLTVIKYETAVKLKNLYESGAKLLAVGSLPTLSYEKGMNEKVQEIFLSIFGVNKETAKLSADNESNEIKIFRSDNKSGGRAVFVANLQNIGFDESAAVTRKLLTELITPDVNILVCGERAWEIISYHYQKDDVDFYLLSNTSRDKSFDTTIILNKEGIPLLWDTMNGRVEYIPDYRTGDGHTTVNLNPNWFQSYVISIVSPDQVNKLEVSGTYTDITGLKPIRTVDISGNWKFTPLRGNPIVLEEWNFRMKPWTIDSDNMGDYRIYTATFNSELDDVEAVLVLDGIEIYKKWPSSGDKGAVIKINEVELKKFTDGKYIDHFMKEADITGLIKKGANSIEIITRGALHEPDNLSSPPIIYGNFAVIMRDGKYVIAPPPCTVKAESWTEFGYPFYSGTGDYSTEIEIVKEGKIYLKMDNPADLVEIIVNGTSAAVLPWEPFMCEITDFVHSGKNNITLRITNSMQNLLLRMPKPSGLIGKVQILAVK
ncbi:MAG: hypothetical protein M1426_03820, partial [Patescibacteria group bacterium]|nr:hypothetical protein [Patescibacteria group bacterium]